jgi:hypothetical protein
MFLRTWNALVSRDTQEELEEETFKEAISVT